MAHTDPGAVVPVAPQYRAMAIPVTAIVLCATGLLITLVAAVTLLTLYGRDVTALTNLVTNVVNLVLTAGAAIYAGSADRKVGKAIEQTNHNLDDRMATTVTRVLRAELSNGR